MSQGDPSATAAHQAVEAAFRRGLAKYRPPTLIGQPASDAQRVQAAELLGEAAGLLGESEARALLAALMAPPSPPAPRARGRPRKLHPSLTVAQRRCLDLEVRLFRQAGKWDWRPASAWLARRLGVTDRAIRMWRSSPHYSAALSACLDAIRAEWLTDRLNRGDEARASRLRKIEQRQASIWRRWWRGLPEAPGALRRGGQIGPRWGMSAARILAAQDAEQE